MKCALAVIRTSSVCIVRLSTRIVNQAGDFGSKNEIFHAGRPFTFTVPSTRASTALCQNGCGCVTGDCADAVHLVEPAGFVQRRSPMMIDCSPSAILYAIRSGATIFQTVS